jgi:hypothetical protein
MGRDPQVAAFLSKSLYGYTLTMLHLLFSQETVSNATFVFGIKPAKYGTFIIQLDARLISNS